VQNIFCAIHQTLIIRKRLNFKMDLVFFELRESEQNENAGIAMNIFRLILIGREYYEQKIIIT